VTDPASAARRFRAEAMLAPALRPKLFNLQVRPHWLGPDRFWYRSEGPEGVRIVEVEAATGTRRLLAEPPAAPTRANLRPGETAAPDGGCAVFCRDNDLWLRDLATDAERRLTHDGADHFAYGASAEMNLTPISLKRRGLRLPANALFSPDGTKLFTSRLDERAVLDFPLLQHVPEDGSVRPVLHHMRFALSGDAGLPMETHCVIDLTTGAVTPCDAGPHVTGMTTCLEKDEAWWSQDGGRVFFLDRDRYWQRQTLWEMNATTGAARAVFTETSDTFIDTNVSVQGLPNIRVLDASGEFIWFSQASGWGHLYLHDLATGARRRAITAGEWLVRDLLHVDEAAREVWFLAGGRAANPYHRTLCRVSLDGGEVVVLTPGEDDHSLAMPLKRVPRDHIRPPMETGGWLAPGGAFFVHTHSDLTSLPVSALRRADGSLVCVLETASIAAGTPFRFAEPFTVTAADGQTTLFGSYWLPTDFDPAKSYPVIDYIYPGPQRGQIMTTMLPDIMGELGRTLLPQAFAELGFVVLNIEGRGNPGRSKAFHDACHGRLKNPGTLEDHVAALAELQRRFAWMDTSRVGIMGHSGGGYATVRAMCEYPEVFHAGIATSGNHDQRGYSFAWTEKYMGPSADYGAAANPPYVAALRGRLLLAAGDVDDNVHPALTMQLVAALIAADKDFDYLPLPNDDHTTVWNGRYFLRRAMDFMVASLGGPKG
jgi:dipeptidyl aminopeptidase/acylaminoacyl peptidase